MKAQSQRIDNEKPGSQEKMTIQEIAAGLECGNPACCCHHEGSNGWQTHCPAHGDENPSLSLNEGVGGKILVRCHAGCDQTEVIQALVDRELWPSRTINPGTYSSRQPRGKLEEAYSYLDGEGRLCFQACRHVPKTFCFRRPDGQGGWEYNLKGVQPVPFNLPHVLKAQMVFIAEGEKDCTNLKNVGLTGSCNPMGAGKWRQEYNHFFKDKEVIILPDNDEPGRKHADAVARHLHGIAKSVKILALPGLPEKGDVSDWLEAGGTAEELQALAEATPEWQLTDHRPNQVKKARTEAKSPGQGRGNLRAVDPDEEPELTLVKSVLPDAPVPDGVVVPEGWALSSQGVGKLIKRHDGLDLIKIAPTPILITGRLRNIADDTESVKLAWPRDGEWRQRIVDRVVIVTTRAITELANVGAPVTCRNASDLVQYFADFESANLRALPPALVSQQMGWQGENGQLGFLWGRTLLRPELESKTINLDSLPPYECNQEIVAFRGADTGDEQIADALRSCGTFEEWVRAVNVVADYPRVLLAIYGALAAPLLKILDADNFIMDWCCRTSAGKTTTVRVGGSCWGNPDERAAASVVGTWDATRVWISRASAFLHSLPLILDDTKRCKNPKEIAKFLYDVASGRERGRGTKLGMSRSGTWRTVLLSTGEAPATSFTTDGGTRARVLTLWGHPFGRADQTTAPVVQELNLTLRQNYGHAGPLFVKFLLSHQEDWAGWRNKYHDVQEAYRAKAGADPVAGRLCAHFAALDFAAGIAHAALDLPWVYHDPVENLWHELIAGAEEADVAFQALTLVTGWAKANQMRFYGRQPKERTPSNGWAGKWDSGKDWEYIAFLPHFLNQLLTESGFEPEAVIRTWQDRLWLLEGKDRRQKQMRLEGEQTYTIALRRTAIEEKEGGNDDVITN